MKIFVSMGFKDRSEDDILNDLADAIFQLTNVYAGTEIEIVHNYYCEKPENGPRLYCLGEAIKKLSECDACYFLEDWEQYKGCRVEMDVCVLYDIPVIFQENDTPNPVSQTTYA